ncbi:MAG: tyrosine-type recombinase/integrase [Solidesulfovibrio sp. DCME]|uniref:tyrosine-type recombinase/integrase n=1 Tax=Solidesulfovibrio sp. DCME TaxID=3447380 RepID=UPI003D0CEE5B
MNHLTARQNLPASIQPQMVEEIPYLLPDQVAALTTAFQEWFDDAAIRPSTRKTRGRYWLAFLFLRFTGARLGEVLSLNDVNDIDYRAGDVKLVTLKRHAKTDHAGRKTKSVPVRLVPVPPSIISELATYLAQYPDQRGRVFMLDQGNMRRVFYDRAKEANLPRSLSHPHVLRHTRAIEMTRLSVPLTGVQSILGHSSLNTTAIYTRLSNHETKQILHQVGLI